MERIIYINDTSIHMVTLLRVLQVLLSLLPVSLLPLRCIISAYWENSIYLNLLPLS